MFKGLIGSIYGLALVAAVTLVAIVGHAFGPGGAYLVSVSIVAVIGGYAWGCES